MMNLCDSTPQCLAQSSLPRAYNTFTSNSTKSNHHAVPLGYGTSLLELGKPLKNITMQDIVSKLPNGNQPNQATLLQQQIEMLDQPEGYHQCETQVLRRLADGRHGPASGGETPAGGSPPAGSEHVPRETSETQRPNPPRGELPSGGSPPRRGSTRRRPLLRH